MKTEELIIDGVRVDMSPDTRIVLNFKSNLLGDVSKITASNSQTIQLPKTIRNRMIFDHATTPARGSVFPYQRHAAEYIRNGVKIISDAYAVMLSASENFEVALYWGEMTRFQTWVESGAKLNDLSFDDLIQIWSNTNAKTYCVSLDDDPENVYIDDSYFINADYDCGVGSTDTMPANVKSQVWLHKFVSVRMILAKIQSDSGITFEFPDGYMSRTGYNLRGLFRSVAVALTTRKTSTSTEKNASGISANVKQGWCNYNVGLTFSMPASTYYSTENKNCAFNIWGETAPVTVIKSVYSGRVKLAAILIVTTSCGSSGYKPDTQLKIYRGSNYVKSTFSPTQTTSLGKSGGRYYFLQSFAATAEFDINEGDEIYLGFELSDGYRFHELSNSGSIGFTPPPVESNISLGEYFKAKGNFPDITQLDFVKAVCGLFGLYVVPSGVSNKLKFATLDTLADNKDNAVDWSSKLVRDNTDDGDPREIKYTFGDYARRNWFRYKDDETVTKTGDAPLIVNNESLELEKDVITIPFAASDEKQTTFGGDATTLAVIPHYTLEDGTPKDVAVSPRLVCMRGGGAHGNEAVVRFDPITFSNMIARYYSQLSDLLNSSAVIKERIRLTEFDLLNLDFTKPVFLKQYGRYYAIISIQTAEEYCTVELLQLPTPVPFLLALLFSTNNGATWASDCPEGWSGTLLVRTTAGRMLTADDISDIGTRAASTGTAPNMDLTECEFLTDSVGIVNRQIDSDNNIYSLDNVRYIHFPPNVKTFARKSFYYTHNVLQFYFPDGVVGFAWQSFEYCYALREVEFPASVEWIDDVAFGHCYDLTTIRFKGTTPPEITFSAFHSAGSDMPGPKRIYVPRGTTAAYYAEEGIARIVDDFDFVIVEYDL